jgi:hypothetical protein
MDSEYREFIGFMGFMDDVCLYVFTILNNNIYSLNNGDYGFRFCGFNILPIILRYFGWEAKVTVPMLPPVGNGNKLSIKAFAMVQGSWLPR